MKMGHMARHSIAGTGRALLFVLVVLFGASASAQYATGDYVSWSTGPWNTLATWRVFNGVSLATSPAPTALQGAPNANDNVWIRNGTTLDLSPVGGTLSNATVWVRLNSTTPGASSGQVQLASPGTNGWIVAVSGVTSAGSLPTLFLNELRAFNGGSPVDENNEADDWFEIFNPNNFAVDLAGWYVSDALADLTKYRFSTTGTDAVVPANGWLLVWADNQSAQGNLHTNFSVSSTNGEDLMLVGPDGVTIVDQVSFGPQAEGVSHGRQTDGGTPWVTFDEPTPGASNNPVGISESRVAFACGRNQRAMCCNGST